MKYQSSNVESNDGIIIFLDPKNRSLVAPGKNIFKIILSAGNNIAIFEGNNKIWVKTDDISGISTKTKNIDSGYLCEIAIPWTLLDGEAVLDKRIGFTMELSEKGNSNYTEGISNNISSQSFTWSTLYLK